MFSKTLPVCCVCVWIWSSGLFPPTFDFFFFLINISPNPRNTTKPKTDDALPCTASRRSSRRRRRRASVIYIYLFIFFCTSFTTFTGVYFFFFFFFPVFTLFARRRRRPRLSRERTFFFFLNNRKTNDTKSADFSRLHAEATLGSRRDTFRDFPLPWWIFPPYDRTPECLRPPRELHVKPTLSTDRPAEVRPMLRGT